jgi:hypothetical protein
MSHTFNVKTKIKNKDTLKTAVERMAGKWLGMGTHNLYGSNRETGYGFKLEGWRHTIVWKEATGELAMDKYGNAATADKIEKLQAYYGAEEAKIEALQKGFAVTEQIAENGNIELIFNV